MTKSQSDLIYSQIIRKAFKQETGMPPAPYCKLGEEKRGALECP